MELFAFGFLNSYFYSSTSSTILSLLTLVSSYDQIETSYLWFKRSLKAWSAALIHMTEDVLDALNIRVPAALLDILVALVLPSLHLNKLLLRAKRSSWSIQASASTLEITHNGVN